jgi:hypothetical protein
MAILSILSYIPSDYGGYNYLIHFALEKTRDEIMPASWKQAD